VHLGFLGALSGAGGQLGQSIEQGAELAVNRYNKLHPDCAVSVVKLDSAGDPVKAPSLATQAAGDTQMVGLIGPLFSGESESSVPLLTRAGLPAITPSASRSALSGHGWRVFHRAIANDTEQGPAAARYIRDELHADKVFVIDDGSAYGQLVAGGARQGLGGAVVGTDRVLTGRSLSGIVQRVKTTGASVVYYGGYYDGAGPLLKELRAAGVTAAVVGGDGIDDPSLASLAGGQDIDGTVATAPVTPASDAGFLAAFRSAYGEPSPYAGVAYDVANIFLVGIEHGVGTRAAMLDFVNSYDGAGVCGGYRFTANGELDPSRVRVGILVFRGGQFVYERSEPGQ
jgi:branched-chain amino acid transport system substrate-binding protein